MNEVLAPALTWMREHAAAQQVLASSAVIALAAVTYLAVRAALLRVVAGAIRRSRTRFDDVLLSTGLLERTALLAPVIVLHYGATQLPGSAEAIRQVLDSAVTGIFLLIAGSAINVGGRYYELLQPHSDVPIKSYVQTLKVLLYGLGGLAVVAVLVGRSPWGLLSGVGAVMAVVILVFRDTILSLVASIQIATNKLVKVGDWIEVPAFGADGDVIDIALHTVKVRNWDKTITTIPTHRLVDGSFRNWQGMFETGGRRIKRALYIDMNTVRFCDEEMLDRFERIEMIRPYLQERRSEVAEYNRVREVDTEEWVNGRRLTNLGTFRAYVAAYLKAHPQIHQELTFLVRQLAPTEHGLPLEIYVFTSDTAWANYEGIQADIFDHLLAALPEFGLRVYQQPSGHDVAEALARG